MAVFAAIHDRASMQDLDVPCLPRGCEPKAVTWLSGGRKRRAGSPQLPIERWSGARRSFRLGLMSMDLFGRYRTKPWFANATFSRMARYCIRETR
jgi:hypothetical protein